MGEAPGPASLAPPALRPKSDAARSPVTDGLEDCVPGASRLITASFQPPHLRGGGLLGAPIYR